MRGLESWIQNVAESKRLRRSAQKIVTRWRLMAIAVPWHSWRASVDELRRCVPHSPAACHDALRQVRGRRVKRGDVPVCDGMLRAAACMDESDHHALMYVWHGQTVREDRVGEASARRP